MNDDMDQTALKDMELARAIALESLKDEALTPEVTKEMMSTIVRIEDFIRRIEAGYIMTTSDYDSIGMFCRGREESVH